MKTSLFVIIGLVVGISAGVSNALFQFSEGTGDQPIQNPFTDVFEEGGTGSKGQARLQIEGGPEFDFGTMDRGETLSHSFVFKNVGDVPLMVHAGDTTCKCTVSSIADGEVVPGDSVDVTLEWVAKNFDTEFRQSATIYTNDPNQNSVTLSVHGRVIHGVRIVPYDLVFGATRVGESHTAEFLLLSYRETEFQVTGHQWSDSSKAEFFDVQFSQLTEEEVAQEQDALAGVRATVLLKSGLPIGAIRQTLSVNTNLVDREPFEIPIGGEVVGSVTIAGAGFNKEANLLRMGSIRKSSGGSVTLRIVITGEHAGDTRISIGAVDPDDILEVEVGDAKQFNERAKLYPLTVSVKANSQLVNHIASKQNRPASITINTTHPEAPKLTFRVSFAVISDE